MATKISANIPALQLLLKSAGYPGAVIKGHKVTIYSPEGNRKARKILLQKLAESLKGARWIQTRGDEYGAVAYEDMIITHKPGSGGDGTKAPPPSLSELDARIFSEKGKAGKFLYHGESVDVRTFTSAKQIEESIVAGCLKAPQLGKGIAEVFQAFFDNPNVGPTWDVGIAIPVRKKLGVYIGELLIGWAFLAKRTRQHLPSATIPNAGQAVKFHLPTNPSFSGVDSFIELRDGSFYAMSSKYGKGAKASVFGNLMESSRKLLAKGSLKPSVFRNLTDTAKHFTNKESRSIVYTFGTRNILGIKPQELNPHDLETGIQQIIRKVPGKQKALIHSAALAWYKNPRMSNIQSKMNNQIPKDLPTSLTAMMNQAIASMLNADAESVKQTREILKGKDYWQANLSDKDWEKDDASVKFTLLHSKVAQVRFIGSKSPIGDPTAKQGWVNYELFA